MQKIKSLLKKIIFRTIGPEVFYKIGTLPNGMKIKVDSTDVLGMKILKNITPSDVYELELLDKLIHPNDVCIDIGANIGLYTLLASKKTGDGGKVYSFEPSPNTYKILCDNVKLNSLKNVVTSNTGISDKKGTAEFFVTLQSGLAGLGNTGRGTVVQKEIVNTITLDEYLEENKIYKVDFMKVDVEGYEGHVLRGAQKMLKAQQNLTIMIELDGKNLEHLGFNLADTIGELYKAGYHGFLINRQTKKLDPFEGTNPVGVNFIFTKQKDIQG